jgi:hypothetical protein
MLNLYCGDIIILTADPGEDPHMWAKFLVGPYASF